MKPELDTELIKLIRCPVTKTKLTIASPSLIAALNDQIENGTLFNRMGQRVESKLDAGLVNQAETMLLPVREGIVVLVEDQAIDLGSQDLGSQE